MASPKTAPLGRDIFLSGAYVDYFRPDDEGNPFFKLYGQKRLETIHLINDIGKRKQILDLGGGSGRLAGCLDQSQDQDVVLADLSVRMLKASLMQSRGGRHLRVINADAHHLPFRDHSFDIVVGLDLFCHLEWPRKALGEFRRVLKDQGILILDSTNANPLWALFYPRYLGKNPSRWIKIMRYRGVYPGWEAIVKHYSRRQFSSMLRDAGFRIIQGRNYGPRVCPKWHLVVAGKEAQAN